jgi:hypothetical protein
MSLMDIQEMKLDERYKVVTFETLNRQTFLNQSKTHFPMWIGTIRIQSSKRRGRAKTRVILLMSGGQLLS